MKIDLHAHCYPKLYVDEIVKFGIGADGGVGTKIQAWESAEARIAQMDDLGVNVQVLNLSAPNVYFTDEIFSIKMAQMTNDFLADICRKHPHRFLCLAAVPLTNLDHAMAELARVADVLHMDGVMLGTNINGRPLSDDSFLPFFEEISRRRLPVVLHPTKSASENRMPEEDIPLGLATTVGFLFETTRTVARMVFKGIFEKLPDLTFILPHSGGTIPFLCPRWDIFYQSRAEEHVLKRTIPKPPSYYLKRHYYDTALSYAHSTLRCTLDLAGIDHLVFGTDHPYSHKFRAQATIESLEQYCFTAEDRERVFSGNAIRLFPKLNLLSTLSD